MGHSPRIPELDGLRALAIIAVVAFHYTSDNFPVTQVGWVGVDLFFVISGYLITRILLNSRDRPDYYKNFYARRSLRIFPPYYALLAVLFMANLALTGSPPWRIWICFLTYSYGLTLTFTPHWRQALPAIISLGLRVTWSLSIEELFYLLWAPTAKLLSPHRLLTVVIGIMCIEPALRLAAAVFGGNVYDFFPIRLDGLASGALVAMLLTRIPSYKVRQILGRIGPLVAAASIAGFALAYRGSVDTLFIGGGYTLLVLAFGYAVACCVAGSGSARLPLRALRTAWLRWIGKTSYVIYLVHYPIRVFVQTLTYRLALGGATLSSLFLASDPPRIHSFVLRGLVALISLAITLGVAALSWKYFESPLARYKEHRVPGFTEATRAVVAS